MLGRPLGEILGLIFLKKIGEKQEHFHFCSINMAYVLKEFNENISK
jgi:hypothetical protein